MLYCQFLSESIEAAVWLEVGRNRKQWQDITRSARTYSPSLLAALFRLQLMPDHVKQTINKSLWADCVTPFALMLSTAALCLPFERPGSWCCKIFTFFWTYAANDGRSWAVLLSLSLTAGLISLTRSLVKQAVCLLLLLLFSVLNAHFK